MGRAGEHHRKCQEGGQVLVCLLGLLARLLLLLLLPPSPLRACTGTTHMTPDVSEDVTDHKPEQLCQQRDRSCGQHQILP